MAAGVYRSATVLVALVLTGAAPADLPLDTLLKSPEAARTFDYWRLREGRDAEGLTKLGADVTAYSRNGACQTDAEREITTGLLTARETPSQAQWRADRDAGAIAIAAYGVARAKILQGLPSGDSALDEAMRDDLASLKQAKSPRAKALLLRQAMDQLPMRAMMLGAGDARLSQGVQERYVASLEQEECRNARVLTAWLKAEIRRRGWFTLSRDGRDAAEAAWLITQHADHDVAFQKAVLARLERLLPSGDLDRSHYAYLWDRVAVNEGRSQRYGTQFKGCIAGKPGLAPLEAPGEVDARRAAMGMEPLEAYIDIWAKAYRCHASNTPPPP